MTRLSNCHPHMMIGGVKYGDGLANTECTVSLIVMRKNIKQQIQLINIHKYRILATL